MNKMRNLQINQKMSKQGDWANFDSLLHMQFHDATRKISHLRDSHKTVEYSRLFKNLGEIKFEWLQIENWIKNTVACTEHFSQLWRVWRLHLKHCKNKHFYETLPAVNVKKSSFEIDLSRLPISLNHPVLAGKCVAFGQGKREVFFLPSPCAVFLFDRSLFWRERTKARGIEDWARENLDRFEQRKSSYKIFCDGCGGTWL